MQYFIEEVKAYDKALRLNKKRLEEDPEYADDRIADENEMFLRLRYTYLNSEVQITVQCYFLESIAGHLWATGQNCPLLLGYIKESLSV